MKIKKALCAIIAIVMLLSIAPASAFADGVTVYGLWIGSTQVTSETLANPPDEWSETTFDPATNTLYIDLDENTAGSHNGATVYSTLENLNIYGYLISNYNSEGVHSTGNVTVVGDMSFVGGAAAIVAASLTVPDYIVLEDPTQEIGAGAVYEFNGESIAAAVDFKARYDYDLWVCGTRVTSLNNGNILGDGAASYSADSHRLTIKKDLISNDTYSDSLIYSELPDLEIVFDGGAIHTDAEYGIATTGALTLGRSVSVSAKTCAIAAASLSLDNTSLYFPEGWTFSNGAVRDGSGNVAPIVSSDVVDQYDLWLGDVRVNSANRGNILGDGSASFDPDTNTLTLNGTPNITGTHEDSLIYADGFPLKLSGEGTVGGDADYAVRCTRNLTLDGKFAFSANTAAVLADGSLSVGNNWAIALPENAAIGSGTFVVGGVPSTSVTIMPYYYDLWLGSTRVTTYNRNDILNDGGKAVYDPWSKTLTLNDPEIRGYTKYNNKSNHILCRMDDITIAGSYYMANNAGCYYGLRTTGELSFAGNFKFTGSVAVSSQGTVSFDSGKFIAVGDSIGLETKEYLEVSYDVERVNLAGGSFAYTYDYEYPELPLICYGGQEIIFPETYSVCTFGYSSSNGFSTLCDGSTDQPASDILIAEEAPKLWVGRTEVTASNKSDVLGDGSVSFDPHTETLTLNSPADGFGYHTLADGSKARIYAKNMDLTLKGAFHTSLTSTIFHEYDVFIEDGDVEIDGDFHFRGLNVGVTADNVTVGSGSFQAKGDADAAIRTGILSIGENVEIAGFDGGVTAVDTSAIHTYGDLFSCSGEIVNGKICDGYGNVAKQATIRRASVFYDLWVGSRRVHEYNKDDVFGDGKVRYYPDTHTLTMNDAVVFGTTRSVCLLYEGFDLTLVGSARFAGTGNYGVYTIDDSSLTLDGSFSFKGSSVGISVNDLTVISGGVSATGGDYGIRLNGDLDVASGAEYLHAHATTTDFPVAIETKGSIHIPDSLSQLTPKDVALDIFDYKYSGDPDGGEFSSFFHPGARILDSNGHFTYNLGLRAGELFWGTDYNLSVGNQQVTSMNCSDILGDGKASFDPATNTLTLNDPTIPGSDDFTGTGAKISAQDFDLTVKGSYHMSDNLTSGICVARGSLTLDGDFTFTGSGNAIYAGYGLTTKGTVDARIIPGSVFTTVAIIAGEVTVLAGTLTAGGGDYGVNCPNGAFTVYAPDADGVILDGSTKALYAGALVFDGNTDEREFMIVSPHGAQFLMKTIDKMIPGSYSSNPATHAELLPTSTLGLWVNGKSVNPENCDDIFGSGNAAYDPDTHTLTLADVEYGGSYNGAVIYATGMNLTVNGRAKFTGAQYGIKVDGGSLTVNGVAATDPGNSSGGSYDTGGGLSIDLPGANTQQQINGIIASGTVGGFSAANGAVTVNGKVNVYGETTGILSGAGNVTLNGDIEVGSASCGVSAYGALNASGNIDVTTSGTAIRARSVNFQNSCSIVSPANWSFNSEGRVVLGENGAAAQSVSIRHLDRYGVWLGTTEVTSLNYADVFGDGRASFDPATNTMTLHDPTIPGTTYTGAKIYLSDRNFTLRGTYHMSTDDGCIYGLQVTGGTLALEGFFTFRGSSHGVSSDSRVTVKGELTAVGTAGDGVIISGDEGAGLELLQSYVTETTLTADGGSRAVSVPLMALLPIDGLELIEPSDGRIEHSTRRVLDAYGGFATHAVLRVGRLADGKGTTARPFYIWSADNWNALAAEIESGLDTSGMYFALTANITVTTMLGSRWYPFAGTFDGDFLGNGGYTLNLDLDLPESSDVAPFRFISGATIRNVVIDGSVKGRGASGLVGNIVGNGNVIENCDVGASVCTRSMYAAGLVLDGGSYSTSVTGCAYSGTIYGDSSDHNFSAGIYSCTLIGSTFAGAAVTLTDCLDLTALSFPVGRGGGTATLTDVYYTSASKNASDQSVWDTAKRGYSVAGVGITLTKTSECGAAHGGVLYAAEGETLGFTTSAGGAALAVTAGTLTQNDADASLTMPAENVSVFRNVDLRYDIHFDDNVTGCFYFYPKPRNTCAGDVVRIYYKPTKGYLLDEITAVDSQNAPIAVQTDGSGVPYFIMPADEVYLTLTFKKKYTFNSETGELRLVCGDFGSSADDRWASDDNYSTLFSRVKSVTADPGVRFVGDMSNLFGSFVNCESFDLHNVDVSGMTSTYGMFRSCRSMTSLNVTGWDLSRVTDARQMFHDCRALTSFSFDVLSGAPITDISGIFNSCESLAFVDMTALDPAALPTVDGIFSGCPSLHSVTLPAGMSVTSDMDLNNNGLGWIAGSSSEVLCFGDDRAEFTAPANAAATTFVWATDVLGQRYEFDAATGALTLNWGSFNPSDELWTPIKNNKNSVRSVTANPGVSFTGDCSQMFYHWRYCESIDLSDADVSGVTGMNNMFGYCEALTSLDVSGWDTSGVTDMSYAFQYCLLLPSIDLSGWNTVNVVNMEGMFDGCKAITSIDLSRFDTRSLTNAVFMFEMCTSLESLDLSGWDVSRVESFECMFNACENLESIDLRGWKTTSVTNLSSMFSGCQSLTSLDLRHFDVSSVEFFDQMFAECMSLTSLNLSGWDTSSATSMLSMFNCCSSLTSLDLSGFDTSGVYDVSSVFHGCTSLVSLNISGWDLSTAESCDGTDGIFSLTDSLCMLILAPDMSIIEDMELANGDGGWIVSGDSTETRVSGLEENAEIAAAANVTTYINKMRLAALCTAAMGAAADSSRIRADLYFDIPAGIDPHFFTVTFGGEDHGLGALTPKANGYKFSVTKPAKNMGDDIAYSLTISGVTLKSGTVSIADYAANLAAYYPQYTDFVDSMLAYGAAAQTYFGYDTDNLVSDADLTALASVTAERFDKAAIQSAMIADDDIPVHYSAMNVTFLADTTLSIAFRIKDGFTDDEALEWVNANVTLGGEAVIGTVSGSGEYRFVIISKQNIAITDIDVPMGLVVGKADTYSVSVLNYFASVEAAGSDNLKLLTRALYAYSQAAKAIAG